MERAEEPSPVLTICVPTFNRARYLNLLLQDLSLHINELGVSYELLIGDNASNDDTADVVRKYEDKLAIRYLRWPENVGQFANRSKLFDSARGQYVVAVADDDLIIPSALAGHISYLQTHPDVGAVFAPMLFHDLVEGVDVGQFYQVEQHTRIEAKDHYNLLAFLLNGHIFPEIYVARTSLAREVAGGENLISFMFFVQIAEMVDRTAVTFSPEPYYRQVTRFPEGESHSQAGHEEVKIGWDRYRGGLEYILARFAAYISPEDLNWFDRAIDRFARIRMHVGLRLRTAAGEKWVENYYLANRLRCIGDDSLLPASYETYRINAALEYLVSLRPFSPTPPTVAYYLDDPPLTLPQAYGFSSSRLSALADRSVPLPQNVVLLVCREKATAHDFTFVISEAELLAKFP